MRILALILSLLIFIPVQAEPTRTYTGNKANTNLSGETEQPDIAGIKFSPDGKKVFVSDHDNTDVNDGVHQYTLSTPWDISTLDASTRISVDINTGDNHNKNSKKPILFNGDGTKFFIFGTFGGTLSVYNLTTPYDISSVSASTQVADDGINYSELDLGSDPVNTDGSIRLHDADFNNDGTKMYLTDGKQHATNVVEYNLSTAFDPSTASYNTTLNTETDGVAFFGMELAFDDDGTRMYFGEGGNGSGTLYKIYVYKLSNPFSIASATFVGSHSLDLESSSDGGTMFTWAFGGYNGKKLYLTTNEDSSAGSLDDYIYEFDLSCPYGIVICENEIATVIGGQVEIAKNVIYQNSNTIFKRFDWLRRNEEKTNLNSHNIKLNINNPILASLKNKLENSLNSNLTNSLEYTQASLKDKNPFKNIRNWSHWSHGDISFGRVGEKGFVKPKDIRTRGIMFGADKLINDKIFGLAFRYGNDDVKIDNGTGSKLDAQSYTLNMYGSLPLDGKSNLNTLIGASFLSIDQLIENTITGERYGRQVFASMIYENENEYTRHNLTPFGKFEIGITQLSEYTDFGTSTTNSVDVHERLTFKTGNASGGFKFDDTVYLDNKTLNRNGFIEYIYDLTPDIDHFFKNHIDNTTVRKTIKKHSLHNIRGNIGFEYMNVNGYTFAINYERFQSLSNSAYSDSLLFKLGKKKVNQANFDVIYDPTNNNNTEISYLKNFGNFNLKLNSNYSLFSKIPDYGANLEISGTF